MSWHRSVFGKLILGIGMLLVVSSLGFYFIEIRPRGEGGLFSGLYWSVVTLTTVGYGDLVPTTQLGRILGVLVMISGIGLVSTFTGNLASLMVEHQVRKRKGLLEVRLSNHVVILGWNSSAARIIETLAKTGQGQECHFALVNELPAEKRDELKYTLELEDRLHFVFGDPANKNVTSRAKPEAARVVYIVSQSGLGDHEADQQSINVALTLRNLAPEVLTYGEVQRFGHRENLLRAGVNEILHSGEISGQIMGLMGANPPVWPLFQTIMGLSGQNTVQYRTLAQEEKTGDWKGLLAKLRHEGVLPLALCSDSKSLSLQDMLDESSVLDQYILELFEASGKRTVLGEQGPSIKVNPPDEQELAGYDGILYLNPGREAS